MRTAAWHQSLAPRISDKVTSKLTASTMASQKITVGSRKSQLALIQTHNVMDRIKEQFPNVEFELITMTTTGDEILDIALSKIGEKNLFTRELEQALTDKKIDFIVHSLKDLPTQLPDGLVIGAVCKRDDPRDAVVMHKDNAGKTLSTLPDNSIVGTSSLRRAAQLKRLYPNLQIKDVRGNLNTRFRKLDEAKNYDCLVLAAAGLERMKWTDRISELLEPADCMYAVAQGAMAVECRANDPNILKVLSFLHDNDTLLRCVAERAFLKELEGGCSVPVAVHTEVEDKKMSLHGGVFSIGGAQAVIDQMTTSLGDDSDKSNNTSAYASVVAEGMSASALTNAEKLGRDLAQQMLLSGGKEILKEAQAQMAAEIMELKRQKEAEKLANGPN